jgi:hypothetical protein
VPFWNLGNKRQSIRPVLPSAERLEPQHAPDTASGGFEWLREYTATVRIRRGPGRTIPPEVDQVQGKRLLFLAKRAITPEDNPAYAGETKMVVWEGGPSPVDWLPSGDLIDIQPVEKPQPAEQPDIGIRALLQKEAQHEDDELARQQRFIRRVRGEE